MTQKIDFKTVSDRLEELTDAIHSKRGKAGLTRSQKRDWDGLLDYWHHVEVLEGKRDRSDEPAIGPWALLDVAEKFNLAAPKKIARLRQVFSDRVEKIVGHPLTPQQVSQMYKLLTTFNPAKP